MAASYKQAERDLAFLGAHIDMYASADDIEQDYRIPTEVNVHRRGYAWTSIHR